MSKQNKKHLSKLELEATISMKLRELERLDVIQAVCRRELSTWRAAEKLGVSCRQIHRLVNRFIEHGPAGLISRHRTRKPSNQISPRILQQVLEIIRERYHDFGPTLACEKLREVHNINLAKETVRRLMTNANLWITRKKRAPKIQQPRLRRSCVGELIQIDGSDHDWFEGRAPRCTLLVFVDDATSRLMQLHF
ncbi:helix-turn-helix domain-containing protein, partial [Formosimonas limnophila]|uniref:helix-turn-helix domain-containing protein n=1 Tax=Formosimonas limnophila TaxID=1384487 RepID=UPI00167780B4